MTAVAAPHLVTADEFLEMDHTGLELVDGRIQEVTTSVACSWIGGEIARRLANHAVEQQVGSVFGARAGIAVWPATPAACANQK
jgi:hypothetical protein